MNAFFYNMAGAVLLAACCPAAQARQASAELDAAQRAAVSRFFESQLAHASKLFDTGRHEQALEKIRAIEALIPDWAGGPEKVRELKTRTLDAVQASTLVSGSVESGARLVETGDPVRVVIRLVNVSGAELILDMGSGSNGGITLLSIRYEERDHFGDSRATQRSLPFDGFEGRITLAPGGSTSAAFNLDTGSASPLSPTIRSYTIGGMVRPRSTEISGKMLSRPITLAECTVIVAPRGSGPTRDAPLDAIAEGIEEEYGPKVFIAAFFLDKERADEGIEMLRKRLDAPFVDPGMARCVRSSIRELAGDPSAPLDPGGFARWMASRGGGKSR